MSKIITNTANLGDAILGIWFSHNIAVISTKSGYASAVSVIIDGHKFKELIGTVAGDNNIIMILSEEAKREDVVQAMQTLFPALKYMD